MKKLIGIIMTIAMSVIMIPCIGAFDTVYAGTTASDPWDGTISQPEKMVTIDGVYYYEISTAEELAYIAQTGEEWLKYNYILANDIVLNDEELTYDGRGNLTIDTSLLNEWIPFEWFNGIFDGDGHNIKGVYVDSTSKAGLFENCNGTVRNLNLSNSYIKGNVWAGGIVASNRASMIENCTFSGAIVCGTGESDDTSGAGGIAGFASISNGGIYSCINYGNVFCDEWCAGGIVGTLEEGDIFDCVNYGNITSIANGTGGITGASSYWSVIDKCKNNGNVSGVNKVGGICGSPSGTVTNCSNYGEVEGKQEVGGIVGGISRVSRGLSRCSNFYNGGKISGNQYIGGLIGKLQGESSDYMDCKYFFNTGTVNGKDFVGGLTGYLVYANIKNGCSTGAITGDTNVGALIGKSEHIWGKGSVSNCYYLKNDSVNSAFNGIGNVADTTDVAESRNQDDFCYSVDGTLLGLHDIIVDEAVEATCIETGLTQGKHCSSCDKVFVEQKTIPAKGHTEKTITGKAATCTATGKTDGKKCTVCGTVTVPQEMIAKKAHTETTIKGKAATCTATGKTDGKKCTVCGTVTVAQKTIAKKAHTEATITGKAATCTATGKTDGKKCTVCGTVTVAQKTIAKKAHVTKTTTTKATLSKNGKVVTKCTTCDKNLSTKTIYYAKTIKLKTTEYTYNGKVKSPTLIVKDSKGNTISSKNYTVTKAKGRKNVGKYTYKIKFKNQYSGSKTLTLTINPKATTIKKPVAAKKAVTIKWTKVSKQATGYEIVVATNKKFTKGKKTVKVTTYKTTSKKITKLKAKKTYYVKVRTYKTVNGKEYYSAWSSVKTVKTK